MTYPDDLEASEADAAEQASSVDPEDDDTGRVPETFDIEVPEADALEQSQEVRTEDDYG
jgi:hypothetical protein